MKSCSGMIQGKVENGPVSFAIENTRGNVDE
jgi:hypothetical protein